MQFSMRRRFSRFLKVAAVKATLRKPSPSRIPLTGKIVRQRNYYTTDLIDDQGRSVFLAREISQNGIEGLWFDPDRSPGESGSPCSVPIQNLDDFTVQATHYFCELEIRFTSAWDFHLNRWIYPRWKLATSRLGQWLFNRRKLVRHDRMRVLELMLDLRLSNPNSRLSELGIMTEIYGIRWALHPDNELLAAHYKIVMQSLAESGDLSFVEGTFQLRAQGLATLDGFEKDEQRHRDMVRQQWTIAILTAALVIVGCFQAYVGLIGTPT